MCVRPRVNLAANPLSYDSKVSLRWTETAKERTISSPASSSDRYRDLLRLIWYVPPAQLQALQFLEMTITSVTDKDGQMIMISRLHALMGTAIRLHADTRPSRGHFKGGRFAPRAPGKPTGGGRGRTK